MITRIEIDGFKSFQDFSLNLAPFQVIIGPNGCGKSNLFDAIHFLSLLTDKPVNEALQSIGGEARDLFTILPDGTRAKQMRFAVEMRVAPTVTDAWGDSAKLEDTHFRYELSIPNTSDTELLWTALRNSEALSSVSNSVFNNCREKETYLGTKTPLEVPLYPDINLDIKTNSTAHYYAPLTTLSRVDSVRAPHCLAVRQEMQSWRQFNPLPVNLRQSSATLDTPFLTTDGKNLAAALARIEQEDRAAFGGVSRDLINLTHSISRVGIVRDAENDRITVYAANKLDQRFPARVLSDGTLRLLALATLRNDPAFRGTLCFEDPEIGVHPGGLRKSADILRDMTLPFDPEYPNEPQRQVIVTTHSTDFISHLNLPEELLYAEMVTQIKPGTGSSQVTLISPVYSENDSDEKLRSYTLIRLVEFLTNYDRDAKRTAFRKEWRK